MAPAQNATNKISKLLRKLLQRRLACFLRKDDTPKSDRLQEGASRRGGAIHIYIYIYIYTGPLCPWFYPEGSPHSEKGEVLLRGVGTLRYSFSTRCICAAAAWRFDNPHQKVVPRSQTPRSTSRFSYPTVGRASGRGVVGKPLLGVGGRAWLVSGLPPRGLHFLLSPPCLRAWPRLLIPHSGSRLRYSLWRWGVTFHVLDVSHETPHVTPRRTSPPMPFFCTCLAWCNTMSHLTAAGCSRPAGSCVQRKGGRENNRKHQILHHTTNINKRNTAPLLRKSGAGGPFYKLTAHRLWSFGSNFLGSCLFSFGILKKSPLKHTS